MPLGRLIGQANRAGGRRSRADWSVHSLLAQNVSMTAVLSIVLILTSVLLVVFVLLHRGKGGGLSNLFGGGVSSSLGGSSVVEKNLDRYTIAVALIWTACIVGLGLLLKP